MTKRQIEKGKQWEVTSLPLSKNWSPQTNQNQIEKTIENNKSMKELARKLGNGRIQIIELSDKQGQVTKQRSYPKKLVASTILISIVAKIDQAYTQT